MLDEGTTMTKETLKNTVLGTFNPEDYRCPIIVEAFKEFFSQNVCTPKGENRHPSSDVLHQAIEGTKIQGWNHNRDEWEDDISWFIDKNDLDYPTKYRIRPTEPVYEYQFACVDEDGKGYISDFYGEDEEVEPIGIKLIGTKRIRQ